MLYTPRSGTNSICSYFLKQNPNYEYFNQPFARKSEEGMRPSPYGHCLIYENVLVKSNIKVFNEIVIDELEKNKTKLLKDFDKIVLISRRNKTKQAISHIIANKNSNFLDNSIRPYYVGNISDEEIDKDISKLEQYELQLEKYKELEIPIFYYEDLYYGSFDKLFEYLNISYIETDFKNILDIKNKYASMELGNKNEKTLF